MSDLVPPAPPPVPRARLVPSTALGGAFFRLFALQATWNFERMQGLGLAYALSPIVRALAKDDAAAARALVPHTGYFNTHPVMAAVATGVVAGELEKRAAGEPALDDAGLARAKQALGSSLAAAGDPLFWNALRPMLALAAATGWRDDRSALGILTFLAGYNVVAIGYRVRGLFEGYRRGLAYVAQLPRRLVRLGEALRLLGVVLAALLVSSILIPEGEAAPRQVLAGAVGLALGALAFGRARLGPAEWGLALALSVLAWVTIGPGDHLF
ncbi:MAG: PTS system mannose/fructose/sorbose family transporter subunit IID [Candidatus Eisenbacteria bacterium]